MKRLVYSFIVLFALVSCAKESSVKIDNGLATSVNVIFNGFEDDNQTKVDINNSLGVTWESGDVMGVWPLTVDQNQVGTQLDFTLTGTNATDSTTFTGSGWGLICDGNYQYASYFPYSASSASADSISVTYPTGLIIYSNGQVSHMEDYLYMYAPSIAPTSKTEATFNFYQLSAIAKFEITPDVKTTTKFRKITIAAEDTVFSTSATYSLRKSGLNGTTVKPNITSTPSERYIGACLKDFSLSSTTPLTLYFAMCPAKLAGKTLTVKLYDEFDNMYTSTISCKKDQESGKIYKYSATVTPAPKPTVDPATIEAVDLGHPHFLFAPFNLGATSPEENGLRFAYGETETKTSFTRNDYKCDTLDHTAFNSKMKLITIQRGDYKYHFFDSSCDAAVATWGNDWIVPDYDALNSFLQDRCDKEWVTYNGIQGWKYYNVKDKTQFIFIPVTSFLLDTLIQGKYWAVQQYASWGLAYTFTIYENAPKGHGGQANSWLGLHIRPVKLKPTN